MSSSIALLPKQKKDDHPIFLRVCHSPWLIISQKILVSTRAFIASYMTVILGMLMYSELKNCEVKWLIPFKLSNIVYLLQLAYALVALSWTYMHLHYPHHGSATTSSTTRLQKFFSPPRQNHSSKNRLYFSIFYTAAMCFPHVVTLVYWLILVPHKETIPKDLFSGGWFPSFVIFNKFAVNSGIALIEILVLSSIKRQEPIWAHIIGLSLLSLGYVFWAYLGKIVTGVYVYFFFDFQLIGWEYVLVAVVSFGALTNIFFAVTYGLTGVREMLTKKSEEKSDGYTRLPQ